MSSDDPIELDLDAEISKRKLLGGLGVVGLTAATSGIGTLALLSDEETFGIGNNPNVIQAGEIDLTVDWEVNYFGPGGGPETIDSQDEPVDRPGPIVDVTDLKPGDIIEKTLSTHVETNPAFLTFDLSVLADEDNGINNPEDAVDGAFNDSDGTEGGDLAENFNCVVWYDGYEDSGGTAGGSGASPGNNRPDEGDIWIDDSDPTNNEDFEAALDSAGSPSDVFDTDSDLVIASGTLAEIANTEEPILIDSRDQGDKPADYSDSACYNNGSVQYIGCVCWLPRNIPGVDDNIIQTDRLEYQFSFGAIQCRDNIANDGTPISIDVADQPGGGDGDDGANGDMIIDNFEDGDLDEYAGADDSIFFSTTTSPTFDGSYALQVSSSGTALDESELIQSDPGLDTVLDRYPRPGDVFEFNIRVDNFPTDDHTSQPAYLRFGGGGQYKLGLARGGVGVQFELSGTSGTESTPILDGTQEDFDEFKETWHRVEVSWGPETDDEVTTRILDMNGNQLGDTISIPRGQFDAGSYLGFEIFESGWDLYFDYVRKTGEVSVFS